MGGRIKRQRRSRCRKRMKKNNYFKINFSNDICIYMSESATADIFFFISVKPQSQKLINDHLEHRRDERRTDPLRFGIKPTLGDRCVRRSSSISSKPSFIKTASENPSELRMSFS